MRHCRQIQERIDAYAAGLADSSPIGASQEDRRHLSQCRSCAAALHQAEILRRGLEDWAGQAERSSQGVEEELLSRLQGQMSPAPVGHRPWIHLAAVAAALLAAVLLWKGLTPPGGAPALQPDGSKGQVQASQAGQELLRQVEIESSREEILRYLERSQLVLAALMDTVRDCNDGNQVEIAYERRLAESLLFEKQLLETHLSRPGNGGVRKLCDELELVLVDVAAADNCVDAQQIEQWRHLIDSRSTLMRLRMASKEAAI
ncbi:MAG TPA: hypothetical protein VLU25_02415 [Acidobacteriota bacterium]|nr:hypothetical protein [Acidobacteriota bacterium]